jgi:DNA-binding transcriptional MerR regulator
LANIFTIGKVARITGLTPGCIRAWESRYGAVTPDRTSTGRRTYSDDNVSRLKLLAEIIGYGYGISALANLTDEELQQELQAARVSDPNHQDIVIVNQVIEKILGMNIGECDSRLAAAFVNLGPWQLAESVIGPLLDAIDEKSENELHFGHRHLIVNLIRSRLYAGFQALQGVRNRPMVCFTTLEGEEHEIDALLSCYLARVSGISSEYIGPNVSAPTIVEIAKNFQCSVVSVNVRTPLDKSNAVSRLIEVRKILPDNVQLWIGGVRSAEAGSFIQPEKRIVIGNFAKLREELDKLALNAS